MIRKRFDRNLYEQNDQLAKKALLKYLGKGWRENTKKTDPDLIHNNGRLAECEIKRSWTGPDFKYPDVQLPERKGKWKDLKIVYYILNKECTHAIRIPAKALKDEYLREVPNKYVFKGEYFYGIPLKECKVIKL